MKDARGTQIISDNRTQKTFYRREVTLTRDASIDTENENEKINRETKDDNHKPFIFTLCRAISGYESASLSFRGNVPSSLPSPLGPNSAQLTIEDQFLTW